MSDYIGSILELKGSTATVMTDTCDFVKIRRQPGMFAGQEIHFKKSDLYNRRNYIKYLALVASVFIILFSYILYYQFFIPNTVLAYFDVDINPSIEFSVNKDAQVLDVKPLNEDAKTILKNLKLVKIPVKQAIAEVVKESKQQGFITTDAENAVLVSASIDKKGNNKLDASEESLLDNILKDINLSAIDIGNEQIAPEVLKVTPENRDLAIKNKISMGRFVLYKEIRQEDANITLEQAKDSRLADMIGRAKRKSPDNKLNGINSDERNLSKPEGNGNVNGSENEKGKGEKNKSGNGNNDINYEEKNNPNIERKDYIENKSGNSDKNNSISKKNDINQGNSSEQDKKETDNSKTILKGDGDKNQNNPVATATPQVKSNEGPKKSNPDSKTDNQDSGKKKNTTKTDDNSESEKEKPEQGSHGSEPGK